MLGISKDRGGQLRRFDTRSIVSGDARIVGLFDSLFEDTSISIDGSAVELYHRDHHWRGRGEDAWDDYRDTRLATYDLSGELNTDYGKTTLSSLLSMVEHDGAVTVPIRRHVTLLGYLLRNECLIDSCSQSFYILNILLKRFGTYDYVLTEESTVLELKKQGDSIAQFDYSKIGMHVEGTMVPGYHYPCLLNESITKNMPEHPEAVLRIDNPNELGYVLVNLNLFYQRAEMVSKLERRFYDLNKDLLYRRIRSMSELNVNAVLHDTVHPKYMKIEDFLMNYDLWFGD